MPTEALAAAEKQPLPSTPGAIDPDADIHLLDPPSPVVDLEGAELFRPDDDEDQTNFHEIVNEDVAIHENAADLAAGAEDEYSMVALMDVLQTLGG